MVAYVCCICHGGGMVCVGDVGVRRVCVGVGWVAGACRRAPPPKIHMSADMSDMYVMYGGSCVSICMVCDGV